MGNRRIRMSFTLMSHWSGTGIYNYVLNLISLLLRFESDRLTPVLFVGVGVAERDVAPFRELQGLEIVVSSQFDRLGTPEGQLWIAALGRIEAIRRLLLANGIDAVFEAAQYFGRKAGFPTVAWIPDFQHRVLTHMFTRAGYWKRELGFQVQFRSDRQIMVSSLDSKRACERFYPAVGGRVTVVHFAVPGRRFSADEIEAVVQKYSLPKFFYFLPNQFWRHKNHLVVVGALALLKRRGVDVVVAASGRQLDTRDPDYFPQLMDTVAQQGLSDSFRVLGQIPYADLLTLMCGSAALINPSKFEGWSTSVEEAKACGIPLILSDLDVHREQAETAARYFRRDSAEELANILATPISASARDAEMEIARALAGERTRQFAGEFVELVHGMFRVKE